MKAYKQKSSAVRAARKELGSPNAQAGQEFELVEVEGGWAYSINEHTEEEPVIGEFTHCPHCGVHLDNGIDTYDAQHADGRPENEEFAYTCLGCGEEFGPALKPKRTIEVKHHSSVEKPCNRVWEIAEQMKDARRKDVIAKCVEQGIAFYTARTQYQRWFTATKEMNAAKKDGE